LLLDVSELEPPEPMLRVLEALEQLGEGRYLRMLHRREPLPLYPRLRELGFYYLTYAGRATPFEVLIWLQTDSRAATAAQRRFTQETGSPHSERA
jgi:uncharacterized protein (DUF2249 family)